MRPNSRAKSRPHRIPTENRRVQRGGAAAYMNIDVDASAGRTAAYRCMPDARGTPNNVKSRGPYVPASDLISDVSLEIRNQRGLHFTFFYGWSQCRFQRRKERGRKTSRPVRARAGATALCPSASKRERERHKSETKKKKEQKYHKRGQKRENERDRDRQRCTL